MALSRHNLQTALMPLAMVVGALLCRPLAAVESASHNLLTPLLIAAMLFVTFCKIDVRHMRLSWVHLWMLLIQFVGATAVYYVTLPLLGETVAQGAMICVLAPIAMAAVVIGNMLGANVTTMVTYSLVCNLVTALLIPPMLHVFGSGSCTFAEIIGRVAPTLIAPFIVAQLCRWLLPKVAEWFASHSIVSFYLWLVSLVLVMGRTTLFIINADATPFIEVELAAVALLLCLVQFGAGRLLGRHTGDVVATTQSVGQKNTIFAIWLSLNFLDPIASIAPTAYIVWQNLLNSWQIFRHNQRLAKKEAE
ncbi:MAG: transporter [Alistipes sp.]|nr:transporter [Alistipes sp.]